MASTTILQEIHAINEALSTSYEGILTITKNLDPILEVQPAPPYNDGKVNTVTKETLSINILEELIKIKDRIILQHNQMCSINSRIQL